MCAASMSCGSDAGGSGVRDTQMSRIGPNATWESMKWRGPTKDGQLGHQHVSNATAEIPKDLTVFPDAFVYGAASQCCRTVVLLHQILSLQSAVQSGRREGRVADNNKSTGNG